MEGPSPLWAILPGQVVLDAKKVDEKALLKARKQHSILNSTSVPNSRFLARVPTLTSHSDGMWPGSCKMKQTLSSPQVASGHVAYHSDDVKVGQ